MVRAGILLMLSGAAVNDDGVGCVTLLRCDVTAGTRQRVGEVCAPTLQACALP